jgi:hypothetical protein
MTNIIKCENGHFYDKSKYDKCPHCNRDKDGKGQVKVQGHISDDYDDEVTIAQNSGVFAGTARKIRRPNVSGEYIHPKDGILEDDSATALKKSTDNISGSSLPEDSEKTVSFFQLNNGINPVVGWLVCMNGDEKGRDFRLVRGFNHIGRNRDMDVSIGYDRLITRDTHCSVVYDDKSNMAHLVPGKGTLTYISGDIVSQPVVLKDGDEIEIGNTKLVYISFCRGDRKWERE